MNELMIKIDNVSKKYKLGQIGGTTLRDEIQRVSAKMRGKEDPTKKIGARNYNKGETFMALNGVSFEVHKGERVGIIGHNGAGKSTLLKLISRITAPTEGMIGLNGRVASMLEVGTGFHQELTGRENIYMNGAILGMTKKEIDAKIEDIIDFSECRQFIDTPIKRYSSGMYIRLAFSVAAHLDSEIMIMDEVLAVGDMAFQKKCLDKMSDVSKSEGRTILYVSHNMNTIRQLCDRVIVLSHGQVVFDGDVEEGIGVYFEVSFNDDLFIDYRNVPRLEWLRDTKIKTVYAEYIDKKSVLFNHDEKMKIKLRWINEADVNDLCLRIEILALDRKPFGTAFIYDFYSGKKDEYGEVCISVDTRRLAPGKYTMNYVFFQRGHQGVHVKVDAVHGLYFEMCVFDEIRWEEKTWGSVMLPDLELIVEA